MFRLQHYLRASQQGVLDNADLNKRLDQSEDSRYQSQPYSAAAELDARNLRKELAAAHQQGATAQIKIQEMAKQLYVFKIEESRRIAMHYQESFERQESSRMQYIQHWGLFSMVLRCESDAKTSVTNAEDERDVARGRITILQEQLKSDKKQIEIVEKENTDIQAMLDELARYRNELLLRSETVQAQLEVETTSVQEAIQQVYYLEAKIADLEKVQRYQKDELQSKNSHVEKLLTTAQELKNVNHHKETQIVEKDEALRMAQGTIESLNNTAKRNTVLLNEILEQDKAACDRAKELLEKYNADMNTRNAKLSEKIRDLLRLQADVHDTEQDDADILTQHPSEEQALNINFNRHFAIISFTKY